jgi:hypothetical protein
MLTRITPGTMSLRPNGSNHVLKSQHTVALLNSDKLLAVENKNFFALRKAVELKQKDVVDALWNLERTRYKLRNQDPVLFAKLAGPTEAQRSSLLQCYTWTDKRRNDDNEPGGKGIKTLVRHELHDANIWRIICSFV